MTPPGARSWPVRALAALWGLRGEILSDSLIVGGVLALVYGISQVSVPAAWIAGGVAAVGVGWLVGRS